jgi:FkbH-like protein
MILRKEHFASIKCNWNDKAVNMVEIAKELNIGLESIAYLDDNPVERASMMHKLPQVYVIEFPEDVTDLPRTLKTLGMFDLLKVSKEDLQRTRMYLEEKKREELKSAFSSINEYLFDLEMQLTIEPAGKENIERIAQLINKTNQFNLRTRRYTVEQVRGFAQSPRHRVFGASLKDKFGEFGLIGVLMLERKEDCWFIDTFLLSCRAMSRGVEKEFLRRVLMQLDGPQLICGEYLKTPKNSPVERLYESLGFSERAGLWWLNRETNLPEEVKWLKVVTHG